MAADTPDLRKPEALVPMGDYTMDEAQIMYDYCGIVIEDFAPLLDDEDPTDAALAEDLEQRLKNPGFTKALLHISYRRANPRATEQQLRRFFGQMDKTEATLLFIEISGLEEEKEDEEDPTAEPTSEPDESSPRNSDESSESSGATSTKNSDEQDGDPETTGTDGSDTSSPALAPTTLVP